MSGKAKLTRIGTFCNQANSKPLTLEAVTKAFEEIPYMSYEEQIKFAAGAQAAEIRDLKRRLAEAEKRVVESAALLTDLEASSHDKAKINYDAGFEAGLNAKLRMLGFYPVMK